MTRNEKIMLISVITCMHRIEKYLKSDIYFKPEMINNLKTGRTYLKKVLKWYEDRNGYINFDKSEVSGMKNRLDKHYTMTVCAKEVHVSSDEELQDLSIINLALCQIEEALNCMKKLDKEVIKNLKYAKYNIDKFINFVVEVAG